MLFRHGLIGGHLADQATIGVEGAAVGQALVHSMAPPNPRRRVKPFFCGKNCKRGGGFDKMY